MSFEKLCIIMMKVCGEIFTPDFCDFCHLVVLIFIKEISPKNENSCVLELLEAGNIHRQLEKTLKVMHNWWENFNLGWTLPLWETEMRFNKMFLWWKSIVGRIVKPLNLFCSLCFTTPRLFALRLLHRPRAGLDSIYIIIHHTHLTTILSSLSYWKQHSLGSE